MEDYSAYQFVQPYTRFSYVRGHVRILLVDEGKILVCGASELSIDWLNVQHKLSTNKKIIVEVSPVGDPQEHGKVERKIKQIKLTIAKAVEGEWCTSLEWQTLFGVISSSINNLPICHEMSSMSGVKNEVTSLDLIMPNRLLLGRNNNVSPVGSLVIPRNQRKILRNNPEIFNVW